MLAVALYALAGLLLLGALVSALTGVLAAMLPSLLFGGLLLVLGLAVERWRYKPVRRERPDPRWMDTGERFIDPESGQLTAVYFDPTHGERHYLAQEGGTGPR
ncbi:MAG: hypothetical protein KGI40_06565 [Xanthomonadaceae bacterium]|nr:hypothetical protein [Xanthomonadaceae bacterium]MDE1958730.1 hypothetical protein [Xanthomonadaceae bacterium]MDE2177846.1 hypothetical protein [Xanthomonadaceae bacterium]MDE2245057.1 hypothetical protein [Xanthomonadaceae bacterium]